MGKKYEPSSLAHTVHKLWFELVDRTKSKKKKGKASRIKYRRMYSWPRGSETLLKQDIQSIIHKGDSW